MHTHVTMIDMVKDLGGNKRTIKFTIEYDGSDFSGWQIQPNRRTVQGEIKHALKCLIDEDVVVTGAGRTDAGVHALGQVASIRTDQRLPLSAFKNGLNAYLPEDVRIVDVEEAPQSFDARRDAQRRVYRYVLCRQARVLGRQYAWHPNFSFSLEPMKQASECLVGRHDFTSFCKKNGDIHDYHSHVMRVDWDVIGDEIHFSITATHFFHNMVRIIVGSLLDVGRGKITPDVFYQILEEKDRRRAGPTAPPYGLVLVRVEY